VAIGAKLFTGLGRDDSSAVEDMEPYGYGSGNSQTPNKGEEGAKGWKWPGKKVNPTQQH